MTVVVHNVEVTNSRITLGLPLLGFKLLQDTALCKCVNTKHLCAEQNNPWKRTKQYIALANVNFKII